MLENGVPYELKKVETKDMVDPALGICHQNIRRIIRKVGRDEIAELTGISRITLWSLYAGEADITIPILLTFCKLIGCDTDSLLYFVILEIDGDSISWI